MPPPDKHKAVRGAFGRSSAAAGRRTIYSSLKTSDNESGWGSSIGETMGQIRTWSQGYSTAGKTLVPLYDRGHFQTSPDISGPARMAESSPVRPGSLGPHGAFP